MKKSLIRPLVYTILATLFSFSSFAQNEDGNIYMPEEFSAPYAKITSVNVSGNKRTNERIIIRELDFKMGDSLATFEVKEGFHMGGSENKRYNPTDSSEIMKRMRYSRENIINTKLFLVADLTLKEKDNGEYEIDIAVQERWYFWVFPVVKIDAPNFNDWLSNPDRDALSMGAFTSHNNMWGLSHQASLVAYGGRSSAYGLGYYIPWIGKGQKTGLRMNLAYRENSAVEYASVENERQMSYEANSVTEVVTTGTLTFRPGLYNYGTAKIVALYAKASDSLMALNPNFFPDSKHEIFTTNLYLDYYYDSRNSKSYPLKGNMLRVFTEKKGMGIITHDVDYYNYGIDFHFYQQLSKKFFVAEMVKGVKSSSKDVAYYFQQNMTTSKDFIRGFDYYALRGDQMYYFRSNIKYELVSPRVKKQRNAKEDSKFKNIQYAFYLNLFADAGMVDSNIKGDNLYNNKMLGSWGLAVDLVSYYDLVLRFEYAFTSIGTNGFFFGFGAPI